MKLQITGFILLTLLASSCGIFEEPDVDTNPEISFNMTVEDTFMMQSPTNVGGVDVPQVGTPEVTSNSSKQFENNNTDAEHIDSVKLESMNLTIVDPENQDFSFLSSIVIFINAENQNKDTLAYNLNVPDDIGNSLDLTPNNINLVNYVKQDTYELSVELTTDETLSDDLQIQHTEIFHVKAEEIDL